MDVNEARGDNVTALHLACAAENRSGMISGLADYLRVMAPGMPGAQSGIGSGPLQAQRGGANAPPQPMNSGT